MAVAVAVAAAGRVRDPQKLGRMVDGRTGEPLYIGTPPEITGRPYAIAPPRFVDLTTASCLLQPQRLFFTRTAIIRNCYFRRFRRRCY